MRFSLDVLKAKKGDCLMVHWGTEADPHLMLVDGGPSGVYGPQLKPRLALVHRCRRLDEADPLGVDAVMVSHIDDDHIKGILELTREQREEPDLRLKVGTLLFNSLQDLLHGRTAEVGRSETASVVVGLDPGKVLASYGEAIVKDGDDDDHETLHRGMVLASIPQANQLRDDAERLRWSRNRPFGGRLIVAKSAREEVMLGGGLRLTVLGPMQPELDALRKSYDDWLREQAARRKADPQAELAAFKDESVPNLSSIVVMAEADGKRMLLTGDARGDKILVGMELANLLAPRGTTHVELLKVPHHGSDNNMETSFFRRITADHYVFSGDGEHGNPERATLEMLFDAREGEPFTIHFTYPVAEIDAGRKAEWEEQQRKEKARRAKKPKAAVREDWSDAEHGLAPLLATRLAPGQSVEIVGSGKPHVIDLLAPVRLVP